MISLLIIIPTVGLLIAAYLAIMARDGTVAAYCQVYGVSPCSPARVTTTAAPARVITTARPQIVTISHETRRQQCERFCRDYRAGRERFLNELLTVRDLAQRRRSPADA